MPTGASNNASGTRPARPGAAPGVQPWSTTNKGQGTEDTIYVDTNTRIESLAAAPAETNEALHVWTDDTIQRALEAFGDEASLLGLLTEDLLHVPFENSIDYAEYDNDAAADDQASLLLLEPSTRARLEQLQALPSNVGNTPSHMSSSSLVVITPPSNYTNASSSSESGKAVSRASASLGDLYDDAARTYGPCSNTWQLPQWRTRNTKKKATGQARKRAHDVADEPQPRRPFADPQQRDQTALTRQLKACIRCRMQKKRCKPNPDDPFGLCLTCASVSGPTMSRLNCLRYKITDAALYREQDAPFHMWSKRWKNMDLVDIADWASDEIKTITISQIFLDAPYKVRVKRFIPRDGDMLEDAWFQNGTMRKYQIPCYALCDMAETATMLEDFIDHNIGTYIRGAISHCDGLIWETYLKAFVHYGEARTSLERDLILDTFRVWVACRKTSNPHRVYGDEKLGAPTVKDPGSLFNNVVPMPVIMIAQMECIMYSRVLRPVSKRVLDTLQSLVLEQKPCYWYTIYLCCFVLLHSCAMQTKRDEETAHQYNLKERFANPFSIQAHHSGAQTILAHWHYINKGQRPFQKALTKEGLTEVRATAGLTEEQARFTQASASAIRDREGIMQAARDWIAFGNDWFWISQLYDEDWKPGESA
ncbi:hypothetical protein LTR17_022344 [Elasticomyces elasticus]|nr:hypothetical protein LTR17_022344 [Elasticomyces elasticus]